MSIVYVPLLCTTLTCENCLPRPSRLGHGPMQQPRTTQTALFGLAQLYSHMLGRPAPSAQLGVCRKPKIGSYSVLKTEPSTNLTSGQTIF